MILGYVSLIRMPLLKHTSLGYPFDIKRFMRSEIHSRYTHPKIGSINQKIQLFKVKVSNTILNIFGVTRATGL